MQTGGDTFRLVRTGEKLRIPAAAYNAFVELAQVARGNLASTDLSPPVVAAHYDVLASNGLEDDLPVYSVLAALTPVTLPAQRLAGFLDRHAMAVTVPVAADRGRLVILQEQVRAGTVGRAIATGLAVVKVELLDPTDQDDDFADVNPGRTDCMLGAAQGQARILWTEAVEDREDPDVAWCVVRLGDQGPGGTFDVKVTIDGGAAGPPCSWTYSVATIRGKVIGTGLTPEAIRWENLQYAETPDGARGLASYDQDGALVLVWANEVPLNEDCGELPPAGEGDGISGTATFYSAAVSGDPATDENVVTVTSGLITEWLVNGTSIVSSGGPDSPLALPGSSIPMLGLPEFSVPTAA